jgi:hypothetical protein
MCPCLSRVVVSGVAASIGAGDCPTVDRLRLIQTFGVGAWRMPDCSRPRPLIGVTRSRSVPDGTSVAVVSTAEVRAERGESAVPG